jgi:hypothetical protein
MVTDKARSIGSMNHKRSSVRTLFAHPTLEALRARAAAGDGLGLHAIEAAMAKGDVAALCEALEAARSGMTRELAVKETRA